MTHRALTYVEQQRRSFLLGLGSLGVSPLLAPLVNTSRHGSVLGPADGEHLVHFRDHGHIFIKAGAATGSESLSLGTQQVTRGAGIPIHRHPQMDEAFYVLDGSGIVTLNDVPHPFEKGGTIVIPKNTWHGFANPDHEVLLLWITAPAGLDSFFRETCSPPGVPPKALTREQIKAIALKFGTEFR